MWKKNLSLPKISSKLFRPAPGEGLSAAGDGADWG